MIEINRIYGTLPELLDFLQKKGALCFTKHEIAPYLDISADALNLTLHRQRLKKRILRIRKDFYIIIPIEYQDVGSPPPEWFIDQLMTYLKVKYYVGLLSAASLHGAAHQQPMQFQVITEGLKLRDIRFGRVLIHFVTKHKILDIGIEKKKTASGYFNVSCSELTIYDLVRYPSSSGQLNNIATIIAELSDDIKPSLLVDIAMQSTSQRGEMIYWQRLGYMMDFVEASEKAELLAKWIKKNKASSGYLVRSGTGKNLMKSERWNLYINSKLEPDL